MQRSIEKSVFLLIEDAKEQSRNSEGPHGVPDAHHADDDRHQPIVLIEIALQLGFLGLVRFPVRVKNKLYGHIVEILCGHAKPCDHPRETARGVGTTTEPEEIDFVPRIVDIRDEFIAILNLVKKSLAHSSAEEVINRSSIRANAAVVVAQL